MAPSLGSTTWPRPEVRRRVAQPGGGCRQRPGAADRPSPDRGAANLELVRRSCSRSAVATPRRDTVGDQVSEFMLQQTPVERVRGPVASLAGTLANARVAGRSVAGRGGAAWGRLGYPRRALRLHQAARMITDDFNGQVPRDRESLLRLPGVGSYTAAAIGSFAHGRREIVLDTNVHRVIARVALGAAFPSATQTTLERAVAEQLAPRTPHRAARWAVASMELGALVCRARSPRCDACPVADLCAWRQAGHPTWMGAPRRGQAYMGTDRQCRGALLAVLRSSDDPIDDHQLGAPWPDAAQRRRARWPRS